MTTTNTTPSDLEHTLAMRIQKLEIALMIIETQCEESAAHIAKCALDSNETLVLGY